jgi:hypothetical protein
MMRALAVLITALLSTIQSSAAAPLAAPIDACIRANAAKVEAAVPDLRDGVRFLVEDVCAEPIAVEQSRQQALTAQANAAHWKKMCDEQKSQPRQSNKNKLFDACSLADMQVGFTGVESPQGDNDDDTPTYLTLSPPAALALASQMLLDLRLAHSQSRQNH